MPVCLRVLPVPERVPCEPYLCHRYFSSSPTRPLLLVFFQVYRAESPLACQCQRLMLFPLVTGAAFKILAASATAQLGQRSDIFQPQFTVFCVLADL